MVENLSEITDQTLAGGQWPLSSVEIVLLLGAQLGDPQGLRTALVSCSSMVMKTLGLPIGARSEGCVRDGGGVPRVVIRDGAHLRVGRGDRRTAES